MTPRPMFADSIRPLLFLVVFQFFGVLINTYTLTAQDWLSLGPFEKPAQMDTNDRSLRMANGAGRVGTLKFSSMKRSSKLLLCTPFDGIRVSQNKGASWQAPVLAGLPAVGISDMVIDHCNHNVLIACTGDADAVLDPNGPGMNSEAAQSRGIYRSADNGATWSGPIGRWMDQDGKEIVDFWKFPSYKVCRKIVQHATNSKMLLTIIHTNSYTTKKFDSYVYRSLDGGLTWRQVLAVADGCFKDLEVDPNDKKIVYVGGRTVYRSMDFGKTWQCMQSMGLPKDSLVNRCEIALSKAAPGKLFVLVNYRKGSFNDLFIAKSLVDSLHKVCSGAASPTWRTTLAVDATNPGLIYFSAGNKVNRFEQSGASWRTVAAGIGLHDDLHDLTADPTGGRIYASTDGGLSVSTDSGKSWLECYSGLNVAECWGIAVSSVKDVVTILAGLQDAGTIMTRFQVGDNSANWTIVRGGDGMKPAVSVSSTSLLYSNDGNNNLMYRSQDGGATWKQLAIPRGLPAEYLRPLAVDAHRPNRLLTGYNDLFYSNDSGNSWKALHVPPCQSEKNLIVSTAFAPSDSQVIYVAYSQPTWSNNVRGKLFRTSDGGVTWEDISAGLKGAAWAAISTLAVHPTKPDLVFVGFKGAASIKAMCSESGGKGENAWKDVSSGLPMEGDINAICVDPDYEFRVYAATHHGVWELSSANSSWFDINGSARPVYTMDIVMDTVNRLLFAGTHGAGIRMLQLR